MSEFDDALQALDDAIYLFTKPGGGHTDTGKRLIAAKAEFKACRQALVTATLEQSGAIFQVQKLQAELLNHRHSGGDGEAWRSIESAPRDGERIILGRPDLDGDGGGISVAGYWLEELEDGVDYMGHDGGFTDVDFQVFQPGRSFGAESYRYAGSQPTHWRPLPAPPTQDSAMQQGGGGG